MARRGVAIGALPRRMGSKPPGSSRPRRSVTQAIIAGQVVRAIVAARMESQRADVVQTIAEIGLGEHPVDRMRHGEQPPRPGQLTRAMAPCRAPAAVGRMLYGIAEARLRFRAGTHRDLFALPTRSACYGQACEPRHGLALRNIMVSRRAEIRMGSGGCTTRWWNAAAPRAGYATTPRNTAMNSRRPLVQCSRSSRLLRAFMPPTYSSADDSATQKSGLFATGITKNCWLFSAQASSSIGR
jgi:hypothetical protein